MRRSKNKPEENPPEILQTLSADEPFRLGLLDIKDLKTFRLQNFFLLTLFHLRGNDFLALVTSGDRADAMREPGLAADARGAGGQDLELRVGAALSGARLGMLSFWIWHDDS
jgi:hypothetical protein